jgi:hypothetical protein
VGGGGPPPPPAAGDVDARVDTLLKLLHEVTPPAGDST